MKSQELTKKDEVIQTGFSQRLKGKTVLSKSQVPNFSNSPEIILASTNEETLKCSICPEKCIHKKPVQSSLNNTSSLISTSTSMAPPQEQRGGIVKFEKPSLYDSDGNLDSSRYMEYINASASKIQKKWKQYNYSKKVKINMYRGGIVPLKKRCKSLDNIHIIDEQNANYIYNTSLYKRMKPQKLRKIPPQVITKSNKSNFATYAQKNISSNFKFRANKKIQNTKKINLKYQVADLWVEENAQINENAFTIQKKESIIVQGTSVSFIIKAPMHYSEGTNTITWEETNKHISQDISFTIEKMKRIFEITKNYSITLAKDTLYWNRKIKMEKSLKNFTIDKLDKSKFFKVINTGNNEIYRDYERRIWNNMISKEENDQFELINKRNNIFYSINAIDNKDYEINVGLTPKDIMYTLTKRDVMFIWNKQNKVDSIENEPYNCNHNNLLTFRTEQNEEEENKEFEEQQIENSQNNEIFSSNEPQIEKMIQEEVINDNNFSIKSSKIPENFQKVSEISHNYSVISDSNSNYNNNSLFELQVCSIEVYGKIKETYQNYITSPITYNISTDQVITDKSGKDFDENEAISTILERWSKENDIFTGVSSISYYQVKKTKASESNNLIFNNSFNSASSNSWSKKIYPAQESNIKYIVNSKTPKTMVTKSDQITMGSAEEKPINQKIIVLQNKISQDQSFTLLQTLSPNTNSNFIDDQTQTNHPQIKNNTNNSLENNDNITTNENETKYMDQGNTPFEVNVIQNDEYIQQIKLNLMKSINKTKDNKAKMTKTKLKGDNNKKIPTKNYYKSTKPSININNSINYVQYSIAPNNKELNKIKSGGFNL